MDVGLVLIGTSVVAQESRGDHVVLSGSQLT